MPPLRSPASDLRPQRLLVRGVNWLGDAVMTTPALHRLRERFSGADIALLTHEKLKDLWPGHPAIDRVLTFGAKEGVWSIARRLRAERFDLALLLPNSPRSALEALLARIPRRVGGAWPWRDWMLTDAVPPASGVATMRKRTEREVRRLTTGRPSRAGILPVAEARAGHAGGTPALPLPASHQLHHYLRLVAHLGGDASPVAPHLHVAAEEVMAARAKFGLDPATVWIGLNAGAEYGPAKRWPKESFIAAAQELRARLGCGFAVFGSKADMPLAEAIAVGLESLRVPRSALRVLAGRTSLRELCAALAACRVVLTNDTGPMHVAAALGVPVVVPFGSTSPELTGPGLPGDPRHQLLRSDAACSPCFRRECPIDLRCLQGITAGRVAEAVLRAARSAEAGRAR